MQIRPILPNYNKTQNQSNNAEQQTFTGLSSKLSKSVYTKKEVMNLFHKYESKSNGIIGRAPAKWIYSIPFEERKTQIKIFYEKFGEIIANLRAKNKETINTNTIQQELTQLFRTTGILNSKQKVKIAYKNYGTFADVYKLDIKGESYAIKVFKKIIEKGSNYHEQNGNFFEQPVAHYLSGKIPTKKNNFFKYYFGDLKNGIMVSRFENGHNPFTGKPYRTEQLGIITGEEQHTKSNNLKGRILDIGMVDVMPHAKNKTFRYIYTKTMRNQLAPFEILQETLKWKPSKLYNERLKGVFYSLQIVSDENAKKCLDLLLPAADNEVALFMANNIFYAPYTLRKNIFYSLYEKNNIKIDLALAKKLDYINGITSKDSITYQLLKNKNNNTINKILEESY